MPEPRHQAGAGAVACFTWYDHLAEPGTADGDDRDTMLGRARFQPGRLIWNLETPDLHGDFQRLKAAGATVVQEPYQPDEDPEGGIATFADPDDNDFQLVSPIPS